MKQLDGIVINVYGRQYGKTYRQIKNKVINDILKEINKNCYWNNDEELRVVNNIRNIIQRYKWGGLIMSLLNEDIKYYVTGDDKVLFERDVFTELVYRIHSLEKNSEININTNILLNKRNDKMTELCWNIRDYLITCKQDKSTVDIDMLIDWLN